MSECGCRYWIITEDCCSQPSFCIIPETDYIATDEESSEVLPLGFEARANIAGDYSALNPEATAVAVGETFFITVPNVSFPAGSQATYSLTTLERPQYGGVCGIAPSNNPCCDTRKSMCPENLYEGVVCPPDVPCETPICKEPLCCLNDGCNEGSVSGIPTKDLPVGVQIWVYLCREQVFVKLELRAGLPFVKRPVCGELEVDGCDIRVVGSSGTGSLSYQWYRGRYGDVSQPVGSDSDTLINPTQNEFYWVRVRDECSYCDTPALFFTQTLQIDDFGLAAEGCSLIEVGGVSIPVVSGSRRQQSNTSTRRHSPDNRPSLFVLTAR
jgi:hypothetical protein